MHVLLHDDLGRLTLRRLRPWHRVLARSRAARLDRELAEGKSPEASATLAARAMRLSPPISAGTWRRACRGYWRRRASRLPSWRPRRLLPVRRTQAAPRCSAGSVRVTRREGR
jgi:hypothetical protein